PPGRRLRRAAGRPGPLRGGKRHPHAARPARDRFRLPGRGPVAPSQRVRTRRVWPARRPRAGRGGRAPRSPRPFATRARRPRGPPAGRSHPRSAPAARARAGARRRAPCAPARRAPLPPRADRAHGASARSRPPPARKPRRPQLARPHRDRAVTTLHATRDAADALALSDRIAVLVDGRVVQVGEPPELYWRPRDSSVASALGPANLLPVRVVEVRDTGVVVESPGGSRAPIAAEGKWREGAQGLLCMRPESLGLVEAAMARGPGFPGTVALRVFEGTRHMYEVDIGGGAKLGVE